MYLIYDNDTDHEFDKLNLMTIPSRNGSYDKMKCKHCGMSGKRYHLGTVSIPQTYSKERVNNCPKAPKKLVATMVRVTHCNAIGEIFSNLTPDSVHDVIDPPTGYKNDHTGVWVMGVGEPCKLVSGEFVKLE